MLSWQLFDFFPFSAERRVREKIRQNDGCRLFATKMGDEFGKTQSPRQADAPLGKYYGKRKFAFLCSPFFILSVFLSFWRLGFSLFLLWSE